MSEPSPKPALETPSFELEIETTRGQRFCAWLRTWKGIVCLTLCALFLATAWSGRSLYRDLKLWRAEKLLAQSAAAAGRGDEREELRFLREACMLAPGSALTLRAATRFYENRGDPAALPVFETLLATPGATDEDRQRACRLALLSGNLALGRKWLAELQAAKATRGLPAVLALEAQSLALDGAWESALALARRAAESPGDPAAEKLVLAGLLLRNAEQTAEKSPAPAEVIDLLVGLITRPDRIGLEAISILISITRGPTATLFPGRDPAPWMEAIARHPAAHPRVRVAAWDLLLTCGSTPESVFASCLEKARTADPVEQLEAARWLIQHNQPERSLQLSTARRDASDDWLFVHLDALAALGRWVAVLALLEAEDGPAARLPKALRAVFALRARLELKQPVDASEAWRDIQISLQQETTRNQLYVAQYAERTGHPREAASIYRLLLDRPARQQLASEGSLSREERLRCYSGIIRNTPPTAPAAELLPTMQALSRDFPAMEEARNDATYLRLLADAPTDDLRAEIAPLLKERPAALAYRTTLALLELRAAQPAAAARVYEGWQIDWSSAPDRFKAVRVAVLEANQEPAAAETLRATIDPQQLRPEEAALLRPRGTR